MQGLSAVDGHRAFVRAEPKGTPVPEANVIRSFFEQYGEVHDVYTPPRTPDVSYVTFRHAQSLDQLLSDVPGGQRGRMQIGSVTVTILKAMPRGGNPHMPPPGGGQMGQASQGITPSEVALATQLNAAATTGLGALGDLGGNDALLGALLGAGGGGGGGGGGGFGGNDLASSLGLDAQGQAELAAVLNSMSGGGVGGADLNSLLAGALGGNLGGNLGGALGGPLGGGDLGAALGALGGGFGGGNGIGGGFGSDFRGLGGGDLGGGGGGGGFGCNGPAEPNWSELAELAAGGGVEGAAIASLMGGAARGPHPELAPKQGVPGDCRICVFGMPDGLNADMLRGHFARHGEILDIYVPVRRPDVAYITMSHELEVQDAVLNSGTRIAGFVVKEVKQAEARVDKGRSRGGGDGLRLGPY